MTEGARSAAARGISDGADEPLVETSHALPLVTLTLASRTGATQDPEGREGLTQLLARLMRRTGGGLPAEELDTRIDSLGGSLGAQVSHSTVAFHGTVISRSLDAFVDVVADVIARPGLSEDELARLVRQTEAELLASRDNDRALVRRWFRSRLFASHPYGRSVTGTSASLEAATADAMRALHARTYVTDNLLFGFSGAIDPDGAGRIAEQLRAALPAGARVGEDLPEPEGPSGRRLVFVDKPERTQTQILIGGLGTHPGDADHTALLVANTIFGGTFTARMTQEIRARRGWSYGAYSSLPYDRRRRGFSMWTFPKASDAAACIRLQLEMLRKWHDEGVTKKELAWARRYLARSHAFAVDTPAKRLGLRLETLLYDLPPGYHEGYVERLQAVTLEEANEAVRRRISTENLLVTVVGTEAEIGGAVRDAIDGLDHAEVVPFDADP